MSDYEDTDLSRFPGPPIKMQISMESLDTAGLYMDVVREMATRLLGEGYPESALRKQVLEAVNAEVQRRLDAVLAERVEELLTKPIQKRDAFGNAEGPATNLLDIVASAGTLFLTETVDESGKPGRDAYSFNRYKTRAEWLVSKVVLANLSKEIQAEAASIREGVVKRAKAAVAELLTKVSP